MEFFGTIFYIIIILIFISVKKAAQSANEHDKRGKHSSIKGNYSRQKAIPNVQKTTKTAIPNVPVKKGLDKAFMEPHREEARQPRIRTNNLWGEDEHAKQRIVALRLMEGDPVPEGYVRIRCPYCGADNLVTKHCKQYHSCYFCRVPID